MNKITFLFGVHIHQPVGNFGKVFEDMYAKSYEPFVRILDQHPRIFTRLEVIHRVRGRGISPAAVAEAVELSDTKYCAVHAMLAHAVAITSRYEIIEE